jgi:RNA polymerase sigma-70 factor (ECF subfamily)
VEDESDEYLLEAYFAGDKAAFTVFFQRHFKKTLAYAYKKGIPSQEAADVAQEIFAKLHRSIHLYEAGKPALPWFFTIAHNTCMDWFRRNNRQRKEQTLFKSELSVAAHTPEKGALESLGDFNDSFEKNLCQLTKEQRWVVEKRIMDDLTFKQIAEQAGKSEVSLRKVYQRALEALRKAFSSGGRE